MWTDAARAQYARADLALPSDLTDAEWALLEPFLPPPSHIGGGKWPLRRIVESILSLLRGGAVADAATVLSAGLDSAALAIPVAGQPALVIAKTCLITDRARGDRA